MSTKKIEELVLEWRKCRNPTKRAELGRKIRALRSGKATKAAAKPKAKASAAAKPKVAEGIAKKVAKFVKKKEKE